MLTASPIYDFTEEILQQVDWHHQPYALVYICNSAGGRTLKVKIHLGKAQHVGDHAFSFDGKEVAHEPFAVYDQKQYAQIARSIATA